MQEGKMYDDRKKWPSVDMVTNLPKEMRDGGLWNDMVAVPKMTAFGWWLILNVFCTYMINSFWSNIIIQSRFSRNAVNICLLNQICIYLL